MKFIGFLVILALIAGGVYLSGTSVDVTGGESPELEVTGDSGNLPEYEVNKVEDGEMPSVDVDVTGGEAPSVSVNPPSVDVETKTIKVEVPTGVDVNAAKDSLLNEAKDAANTAGDAAKAAANAAEREIENAK